MRSVLNTQNANTRLCLLASVALMLAATGTTTTTTATATAFLVVPTCQPISPKTRSPVILDARRKLSMAEKRKRRSKRVSQRPDTAHLPPSGLDFKTPPKPPTASVDAAEIAPAESIQEDSETRTQAQQLLDSQRESVAMLTAVKESIDRLPDIQAAILEKGYWYGDDVVNAADILDTMAREGNDMLENMTQDLSNLGSGEFVVSLEGGVEQYQQCPRCIEWVVSTTKNLPEKFTTNIKLSSTNCMATLRTFDMKTLHAARELLTPGEKAASVAAERPFGKTTEDESEDFRRISLRYYLVPQDWSGGGGLSFENGEEIAAKRDRLIVWNSCEARVRQHPWEGMEGAPTASCIELHLIQETK